MSTRPLVIYPDPILSRKCAEVTEFSGQLGQLVADMLETMYHEEGIGLAAPQIGADARVFVSDISRDGSEPLCIVNPVIVKREGTMQMDEGCLSIPGYRAKVTRAAAVRVEGFDAEGTPLVVEAEGLQAVCIQHEIDHLDGVLFIDHLSQLKRDLFRRWWRRNRPDR